MADPARFELTTSAFGGQSLPLAFLVPVLRISGDCAGGPEWCPEKLASAGAEIWCGRRDSNPHSHSRSRFSYHFGFRRRLVGVRGLDYPFAKAF
jgi:hypothetical protein